MRVFINSFIEGFKESIGVIFLMDRRTLAHTMGFICAATIFAIFILILISTIKFLYGNYL